MLKDSAIYQHLASATHRFFIMVDPQIEMKRVYKKVFHKNADLENPKDLVEKTYWLQLHSDTSLWTRCADKYGLRGYVEELGLKQYLPELYRKWDSADDIDLTGIDKPCILKTNNGCAQCVIVKNPRSVDVAKIQKKFKRWLSVPYGYAGGQLHYTKIRPCIIAEELLYGDEEQRTFSPNSLVDYKVWCINGQPESVLIVYDRIGHHYCLDLYDIDWNRMIDKLCPYKGCEYRDTEIPRPQCLEKLLQMATILAKPFPEVRVDFYIINGEPVIGELTFTTGYGYFTEEYYNYLGSKIDLSKVKQIK